MLFLLASFSSASSVFAVLVACALVLLVSTVHSSDLVFFTRGVSTPIVFPIPLPNPRPPPPPNPHPHHPPWQSVMATQRTVTFSPYLCWDWEYTLHNLGWAGDISYLRPLRMLTLTKCKKKNNFECITINVMTYFFKVLPRVRMGWATLSLNICQSKSGNFYLSFLIWSGMHLNVQNNGKKPYLFPSLNRGRIMPILCLIGL